MSIVSLILDYTLLYSLRCSILPPCLALITLNTKRQCTTTLLSALYMVGLKKLTVTRPISEPLCPAYHRRRLYCSLRDFGLRPSVSCPFEGRAMQANSRGVSGANRALLRLSPESSCLELQLSCSPWESSH